MVHVSLQVSFEAMMDGEPSTQYPTMTVNVSPTSRCLSSTLRIFLTLGTFKQLLIPLVARSQLPLGGHGGLSLGIGYVVQAQDEGFHRLGVGVDRRRCDGYQHIAGELEHLQCSRLLPKHILESMEELRSHQMTNKIFVTLPSLALE